MLIRNLQFFEQSDDARSIQGGAFAGTRVRTRASRGFGQGQAAALGLGDFRSFAKTTTGGTASPNTGSGVAGAAASGVDRKGDVKGSVNGSVNGFSG